MSEILNYINKNNWAKAIELSKNLFDNIINGKNLFHYACMRGEQNVINMFLDLDSYLLYLSDSNGNTGAHLLGFNDFDDILLNIILKKPYFLKLKNNNDEYIYDIIIEKIDLLNIVIDKMIEHKYFSHINHIKEDSDSLLNKIIDLSDNNDNYLKLLKKMNIPQINWNIPKDYPPIIYAIQNKYDKVINYIINNIDIDYDIIDSSNYNPLIYAILKGSDNIIKKLLEKNININYSGSENKYVPLSLLFLKKKYDLANLLISHKNINYDNHDILLNTPIYYLIKSIDNNLKLDTKIHDLLKIMIKNSDMTNLNIEHVTPFQLLVKSGLWKTFKNELAETNIDINITDKYGNNPISTIDSASSDEFMEFIDDKIKDNQIVSILQKNDIILPNSINSNFGLFNADSVNSTIYLIYLMKQYPNCIMPIQMFNKDKYLWDVYLINHQKYKQDSIYNLMSSISEFYTRNYYTMLPSIILWRDRDYYVVNKNLNLYLKRVINMKYIRFIILKLSLIVHGNTMHANVILYDKQSNKIMRFEPYGDWEFLDSYFLDKKILKIFKKALDENIFKTVKYIRPSDYLSKTKFQSASLGDHNKNKNVGDPEGYCLAWCYWFLELKFNNPEIDESELVESALKKIIKNDNVSNNPLLNYIRGYGNHLDNQKNIIFNFLKIEKENYYKLYQTNDNLLKIKKYVTNVSESIVINNYK
jgi:hypothetical protein